MRKNFILTTACVVLFVVTSIDITVFIRSISSIVNLRMLNTTDVVFVLAIGSIARMYANCLDKLVSLTSREEEKLLIRVGAMVTMTAALFQVVAVLLPLAVAVYHKLFQLTKKEICSFGTGFFCFKSNEKTFYCGIFGLF